MTWVLDNYLCCWPDGERRRVRVEWIDKGVAFVMWNEPIKPTSYDPACVIGLDAIVPEAWLEYIPDE